MRQPETKTMLKPHQTQIGKIGGNAHQSNMQNIIFTQQEMKGIKK